ncbi:hypothetical protein AB8U03_17370 [Clostridium sp. Mt-5]|uniref:Uncharacterized protein n=1 Tax=Clostridium moutaii TaxID=3240932 RepID=A0ABV4BT05_9CLOT
MGQNYCQINKNKLEVLETSAYDEVRKNHYGLKNSVYKFLGIIKVKNFSKKRFDEILKSIIKEVYKIPMIPLEIFIFSNSIEVKWIANNFQIIDCGEKYLKLSLQFVKNLDYVNIKDLEVNTGSFLDDPKKLDKKMKDKFNYNPKFNKLCLKMKKIKKLI